MFGANFTVDFFLFYFILERTSAPNDAPDILNRDAAEPIVWCKCFLKLPDMCPYGNIKTYDYDKKSRKIIIIIKYFILIYLFLLHLYCSSRRL